MSRPTPEELISDWQRRKAVKAAERAVVEAAERALRAHEEFKPKHIDGTPMLVPRPWRIVAEAVSKLREAREK